MWYIIWLNWLCNYNKIYSWRGSRKHKFCWFGSLEKRFDCTFCLFSLQPTFTVYVWLCVSVVLCWFCAGLVCKINSCCCCTLPAVVSHLPECDAECLRHLLLHSTTYSLQDCFIMYHGKIENCHAATDNCWPERVFKRKIYWGKHQTVVRFTFVC